MEKVADLDFSTIVTMQSNSGVHKMYLRETDEYGLKVPVAVKGLKPEDPRCTESYETELRILKAIPPHTGIPQLVAHTMVPTEGTMNGYKYLIAETYYRAAPLHKLFYEHPVLPLEFIQSVTCQLASIMKHLHVKGGVIYRDLKLPNILLNLEGEVKLVDFGHSALEADAPTKAVGTHHTRAPEVWNATATATPYTFVADFFSFGVVLYELLYGKPPFGFECPPSNELSPAAMEKCLSNEVALPILAKRYKFSLSASEVSPNKAAAILGLELIRMLMVISPRERLCDWDGVLAHPFVLPFDEKWKRELAEKKEKSGVGNDDEEYVCSVTVLAAETLLEEVEMQTLGL